MLDALRERLLEKPGSYRDEMVVFLYDEFGILVTVSSISRALASVGWTKKTIRHVGDHGTSPWHLSTAILILLLYGIGTADATFCEGTVIRISKLLQPYITLN
jgi:hypothetical protein